MENATANARHSTEDPAMCYQCHGAANVPVARVGALLMCSRACLDKFAKAHGGIVMRYGVTVL